MKNPALYHSIQYSQVNSKQMHFFFNGRMLLIGFIIVLKMLPLGATEERAHGISVLFLTSACESIIVLKVFFLCHTHKSMFFNRK